MNKLNGVVSGLVIFSIAHAASASVYVNAAIGMGGMETSKNFARDYLVSQSATNVAERTHSQDGLTLHAGAGMLFAPVGSVWNYGVEFGYTKYAENTSKATANSGILAEMKYERHDINMRLVTVYRATDVVNVLMNAGLVNAHQSGHFHQTGLSVPSESSSKTAYKPELGIGIGYQFNEQFGLDLRYQHVFGNDPDNLKEWQASADKHAIYKIASVNSWLAGFTVTF